MKKYMILPMIFTYVLAMSCRTQKALKRTLYAELRTADSLMDNRIVKNFSKLDPDADSSLMVSLKSIDQQAMQVKNNRLNNRLELQTALMKKVILLHQDPHINYEALGPLLETYTSNTVKLFEQLR